MLPKVILALPFVLFSGMVIKERLHEESFARSVKRLYPKVLSALRKEEDLSPLFKKSSLTYEYLVKEDFFRDASSRYLKLYSKTPFLFFEEEPYYLLSYQDLTGESALLKVGFPERKMHGF